MRVTSLIIIVGIALRALLGYLYHAKGIILIERWGYPDSGNDEIYFLRQYLSSDLFEHVDFADFSYLLYPRVARIITLFAGTTAYSMSICNLLFGAISLTLVRKISGSEYNLASGLTGVTIATFLPMQVLYGFLLLREQIISTLLLISVYFGGKYIGTARAKFMVAGLLSFITAGLFHPAILLALPFYMIFLFRKTYRVRVASLSGPIIATALVAALWFALQGYFEQSQIGILKEYDVARSIELATLRTDRAFHYDNGSGWKMLILAPWNFLLRPSMQEYTVGTYRVINTAIVFLVAVFWLVRRKELGSLAKEYAIVILALILIFALGSNDLLQADRHRSKIIPVLIALTPWRRARRHP